MEANRAMAVAATAIMFVFAAIVLQRFWRRRQAHNLFWGVGLVMFGIGTFAEAYLSLAWNDVLFRLWYVCGAMLNAGWLGHGTLSLLVRRPWVRYVGVGLAALSLFGLAAVFTLPLDAAAFSTAQTLSEQYKQILPAGTPVRMLTPLFNVYGSLFLIGGAVYSAYQFWRQQVALNRVLGNALIAAGALAVASAGTLTRLVFGGFLSVSELIAALLMFSGFMLATAPGAVRVPGREGKAA